VILELFPQVNSARSNTFDAGPGFISAKFLPPQVPIRYSFRNPLRRISKGLISSMPPFSFSGKLTGRNDGNILHTQDPASRAYRFAKSCSTSRSDSRDNRSVGFKFLYLDRTKHVRRRSSLDGEIVYEVESARKRWGGEDRRAGSWERMSRFKKCHFTYQSNNKSWEN